MGLDGSRAGVCSVHIQATPHGTSISMNHNAAPVISVVEIAVKPGRRDEALGVIGENVAASHAEPGIVKLAVHVQRTDPDRLWIVEHYADEAAYRSHLETPHLKTAIERLPELLAGPIRSQRITPVALSSHPKGRLSAEPVGGSDPYVVIADFSLPPDDLPRALALLEEEIHPTHAEAGVRQFAVHQASDDPNRLIVIEVYDDEAARDSHFETPHLKKVARELPPLLAGAMRVVALSPAPLGSRAKGVL
jgi:quinol monooxygenase YgiN